MFPSATDKCIRCYRLRDLLSLVGGYVFVGAVITYPTILPVWSFCPRGVKTPSLFVAYFFTKKATDFAEFTKCLYLVCRRFGKLPAQTSCHLGTKRERKQKRPVLTHTDHGKHQKANGARSLKKCPAPMYKYESKSSFR